MNDDTVNNNTSNTENEKVADAPLLPDEETIDDIQIESYNEDGESSLNSLSTDDRIAKLKEQLRESNEKRKEYLDGWQRLKADFVNYKKKEEDSRSEFLKFAREGIITDILPVLESFHMAFANKVAWGKVDDSWRKGVEYIHSQLLQVLSSHGLTEVNPTGETFDPNEFTSIESVPTDDPSLNHKVAEVTQLGYKLSGKMIRSPRVKVYSKQD